jgi:hypothetical protein
MHKKYGNMKLEKISIFFLTLVLLVLSCNKDDDGGEIPVVEIRDRAEQQIADNDSIVKYFETHYYNSSAFGSSNVNPSIKDLVITELIEGESVPDGNTLLSTILDVPGAALETQTFIYAETEYKIYILRLNQGGGTQSPNFSDKVRVNYEGLLLNETVFDSAVTPVDLDLVGDGVNSFGTIFGWRKVFPEFNVAESFVDGSDGTVNFNNYGLGVMFLPSGVAYFSQPTSGIPSYSPLIFKFELFQSFVNDHDNDGVPSYKEDLNGDGEFTVNFEDLEDPTDDDTDGDGTPDYLDRDDDGDGVLTINEDIDGDGDPTNDIGANGIPKYLDDTETESKLQ